MTTRRDAVGAARVDDASVRAASVQLVADEARWAERIRGGDQMAFDAMFRAYGAPLSVFALGYVGSADDAADVVQDVFVAIWQHRAGWACRGSVRGYLYAAVRNQAISRRRSGRVRERANAHLAREAAGAVELAMWATAGNEGESDVREARLAACERALGRLSDKHRQVLLLRWQHDLTYAEIATALDIPVKTVDTRLQRALQHMRRLCLP